MRPEQLEKAKTLEPKINSIKNRLKDIEIMVQFMASRGKDDHFMGDAMQSIIIPLDLYTAFLFAARAMWEQRLKELEAEMAAI
jgi:hypothetical protein